jgi:ribonuclease G
MGKGTIKSSLLFTDVLEQKIDYLTRKVGEKHFTLYVHPFVASFINKGLWSLKRKWQMKYGSGIPFLAPSFDIIPSQELAFLDYQFRDKHNEVINMQQETDGE